MADWDDDDFDVDAGFAGDGPGDKWEGEDEEEVKDNWEDEEDEKKLPAATSESGGVKAFQVQKKKPLSERIQEKEEEKRKIALEKQKQKEAEEKKLTPSEIQAEKARQQQIQEEADLMLAKEMFGLSTTTGPSIDKMQPNNKEEFAEFAKLLKEKILQFEKSPHYCELLEDVFPGVSAGCKYYVDWFLSPIYLFPLMKMRCKYTTICDIYTGLDSRVLLLKIDGKTIHQWCVQH
ncbi:eukaryotic translation initiation factor 3 subunit J-like [Anneissia japonica]|uniref:eukaryotic translation initiation factor 3 subunit J-like n=1 Tax=Anneissia japonica TaxID=1529436 RepID=UPI001425822C|nr:eukaryotic translation initiation factor 3 subunit J-like [Anneissia japonica]